MRNISFALTTAQVRASFARAILGLPPLKDVTRRRGTWWAKILKPGDLLCAVEKSQGIKKGGLVRLGVIRVVSVRVERLDELVHRNEDFATQSAECAREGFPEMGMWGAFVQMFCKHMGGDYMQPVTRIEFEYLEAPSGAGGAT